MSTKARGVNRQREFSALNDMVYLDHAGSTLVSRRQLEAQHRDLLDNVYSNPHSRSPSSQLSTDLIEAVRYRVLQYLSASAEEYSVIFTSGCTAALKLVAETFNYRGDSCHCNQSSCEEDPVHGHKQETATGRSSGCNGHSQRGSFSYLLDNHTSVQGMRELAFMKAGKVQCIDCDSEGQLAILDVLHNTGARCECGNHLFAYPAQSNFSGKKYPLDWVSMVTKAEMSWQTFTSSDIVSSSSPKCSLSSDVASPTDSRASGTETSCCYGSHGNWFTVLDAASLVSTSPLDLSVIQPDFVTLSFYKMFGMPTGLGALIVRNSSSHVLHKAYYGGGTVAVSLPTQRYHVLRSSLTHKFEDGTVSFLDIIALRHGFDVIESFFPGGVKDICTLTFTLAQYFYQQLSACCHGNGCPLAEMYCDGVFEDVTKQGPIVTFNLLRANGQYIGYSEFDKLAQLYNIHVRTGCFCNIGACQKFLHLSDEEIKRNFEAGHECGDDRDLVDRRPTGAVRVSFGYMSTLQDAQKCLQFIIDCFLENKVKPTYWPTAATNSQTIPKTQDNKTTPVDLQACQVMDKSFTNLSLNQEKLQDAANLNKIGISNCIENIAKDIGVVTLEDDRMIKGRSSCKEDAQFESCEGRQLTDIFLYPVKSCAAFKVQEWPLSSRGLLYDREWMIVGESGIAMSQKREARLCLLQPSIDLSTDTLQLHFPGMDHISIPLSTNTGTASDVTICNSKVCGDRVESMDCGPAVSAWLSEALCRPGSRLIRQTSGDKRSSKLKNNNTDCSIRDTGKLSLANESQYLLISRDSVQALYEKIQDRQDKGDTQECFDTDNLVDRFRGNLVVGGCTPFEEDVWTSVQIGSVMFQCQGLCTRCQMVCMDQQTGERSKEPLKTLAVWRGSKVPFGIHVCGRPGETGGHIVKVGDPVFIT